MLTMPMFHAQVLFTLWTPNTKRTEYLPAAGTDLSYCRCRNGNNFNIVLPVAPK